MEQKNNNYNSENIELNKEIEGKEIIEIKENEEEENKNIQEIKEAENKGK